MENLYSNENAGKNKGMTPKSLVTFMITTCFSRIATLDFNRADRMKEPIKKMLQNERRNHPGEDERYDQLDEIVDGFFEYIKDPKIAKQIANKEITKAELEEMILSDVANIPKRKYDMSDLYRQDLIAVSQANPSKRKVSVARNIGQTYEYKDKEGKKVLITDVGQIGYEEWGGIHARLSIYKIQKQLDDGGFSSDLVCSSIAISEMHIPKYRDAVLDELLSEENMHGGKVGPYIGRISREKKQDPYDLPHTERQDANGYSYRIDDEYILEYDATELTAVIEAIRNNYNRNKMTAQYRNSPNSTGTFGQAPKTGEDKRKTNDHNGHDEI